MKKLLVALFFLLAIGFFFYVFSTQVLAPLRNTEGQTHQSVDILKLVIGYFDMLYQLLIAPLRSNTV
jgi:hypothetical protein